MTGKLTVNMTVNGVGYYRHEMGNPVIKTMEVSLFDYILLCVNAPLHELSKDFKAGIETGLFIDCVFLLIVWRD